MSSTVLITGAFPVSGAREPSSSPAVDTAYSRRWRHRRRAMPHRRALEDLAAAGRLPLEVLDLDVTDDRSVQSAGALRPPAASTW